MRLFDRITRLARADAHGVVDALEDRRLLLRQCLREAELELDRKRARVAALAAEQKRLTAESERHESERAAADADVDLALADDNDELARFAVRRLLPLREALARLSERRARVAEERQAVGERLDEQERRLEELKSSVRAHLAAMPEEGAGSSAPGPSVGDEDVELELLRRRGVPAGGAS